MAGKARRVASRQAQLSRKRRKQQKAAADPLSAVQAPGIVDGARPGPATPPAVEPASPPPAPAPSPAPVRPAAAAATRAAPAARAPGSIRGERLAARNYIGAELRRILLLASVVLAVIVVLGILL